MSLYSAAQRTKTGINVLMAGVVLVVFVRITWIAGWALYRMLIPPTNIPPQIAYGIIPTLKHAGLPLKEGSIPRYQLETTTGTLPILPDRAPVYKLRDRTNTIALEKDAVEFAASLGFTEQRTEESSIKWFWEDTDRGRRLDINIYTNDFILTTDLAKVAPTAPRGSAPSTEQAISQATGFLESYGLIDDFIRQSKHTARYIRIQGGSPSVVDRKEEAQLVEVNIHISLATSPADYPAFDSRFLPETYQVLSNDPDVGVIQVYISNSTVNDYKIPMVRFSAQRLDEAQRSTYPILSVHEAWQKIQEGKGSIAYLRIKGDDPLTTYIPLAVEEIQIRNVSLAYLDTGLPYRTYLQPMYVFEGDAFTKQQLRARYVAYLPAVDARCQGDATSLGKPCGVPTTQ